MSELEVTFLEEGVSELLAAIRELQPTNFEQTREEFEEPYADDGR